MSPRSLRSRGRVAVIEEGYASVERLLAYEIGNQLLGVPLAMQQRFGLRAEPLQILMLIMLASVQRYARALRPDPAYLARTPLPDQLSGQISRRRISDTLGIPVETVRRQVALLISRGLVVEQGRGQLTTPPGTLTYLADVGIPRSAVSQSVGLVNLMLRQGAARIED